LSLFSIGSCEVFFWENVLTAATHGVWVANSVLIAVIDMMSEDKVEVARRFI
jgi:hypothetical protein